jgi:CheY-like chemotaxis protein
MINATQNTSFSLQPAKIVLYIEDDVDDRFIVERTVRRLCLHLDLRFAVDGQQAVEWLRGDGIHADRNAHPLPDLVLFDLKMPRLDGLQLLRWVRSQPQFETLKMIVYSGSVLPNVAELCKELGASEYISKNQNSAALTELLRAYSCAQA